MAADHPAGTALETRKQGEALLALGLANGCKGSGCLPRIGFRRPCNGVRPCCGSWIQRPLGDFRWILPGQNVSACFSQTNPDNPESRPG